MTATDLLQRVGETLGATATVRSVFGEPIQAHNKTVVPVARVAYGFGGGSGSGKGSTAAAREGEGGGGGGAVRAFPAGALEITADGTRFVPFTQARWLAAEFVAGALVGRVVLGRRRR